LRHGLVNEIIAEDEGAPGAGGGVSGGGMGGGSDNPRLLAAALAVASQVAALPRSGVEGYKKCMRDGLALPYGEVGLPPLPGVRLVTWTIPAVINRCFDCKNNVKSANPMERLG
jgi:hypothetical protein